LNPCLPFGVNDVRREEDNGISLQMGLLDLVPDLVSFTRLDRCTSISSLLAHKFRKRKTTTYLKRNNIRSNNK